MGWDKDPVLEGDEVSKNIMCNCCLLTFVIGAITIVVMIKIYFVNHL